MCLAVPMKIVEICDGCAICEIDGVRREASLMMLEEAAVGDHVLIHAGFAIEKIDLVQAEETLRALRDALQTPSDRTA
ncbi:MAG: HypC/HybG/HupF family hydrogenase formation chaperone [Desulfuromonas sp.]|nr:MAG: HypC/HybG/HupF family hydrogenase formation chaperone [Desulfuromonas sp.]